MSDGMQEVFGRLRILETGMVHLQAVETKAAEHDRILHGTGIDAPGLITEISLIRADLREVLEGMTWLKRAFLSALVVPLGLVLVALLFRGAFPGQPLPDLKDEFKHPPPAATAPRR